MVGDSTLLSTMFSEKSMGEFGFATSTLTFDFQPDFWDVMGRAKALVMS